MMINPCFVAYPRTAVILEPEPKPRNEVHSRPGCFV